jgi:diguanylate cyclase (GGDEF)-like protein
VARRTLAALDTVPERASALILMELRNLPDINASLGHQVGDEVLREVARRLQQNVAPTDTIARGGETQFLAIAHDCSAEPALL